MTSGKAMKISDALRKGRIFLKERGVADYKSDALFLMLGLTKKTKSDIVLNPDYEVDRDSYLLFLQRRAKGEPCAYITGETEFMSMPFKVNKNVLIPRQDTELLVEKIIENYKEKSPKILDLCTGSGCIGISLAKYIKNSSVTLADIDFEALETAKQNAELNGVQVTILQDNALNPALCYENFDVIVSNPPYIRTAVIEGLDVSVKDFEPHLALDGGESGLIFYETICSKFYGALKNGGMIAFEIGFDQEKQVKAVLEKDYKYVTSYIDYGENPRVVTGIKQEIE